MKDQTALIEEYRPAQWAPLPMDFDPPLDAGIELAVIVLRLHGVETFQSCEGGEGHSFSEPTVQFHGQQPEGFRALAVARYYQLNVSQLRRTWSIQDGEPVGPHWELVFDKRITGGR